MTKHLSDAMKEWSVVCNALRTGRQVLMFRKGGIQDDDFELRAIRFWLFPTRFHQSSDEVRPQHHDLIESISHPDPGQITLDTWADVVGAVPIKTESMLQELLPLQVLDAQPLLTRFHYRSEGLLALVLRVHTVPESIHITNHPEYDGCRSWVTLREPASASDSEPALDANEFAMQIEQITSTACGPLRPVKIKE